MILMNICHFQQIDIIDIFFVFKQSGLLNFKWSMNHHHNGRKLCKVTLFHVNARPVVWQTIYGM